MSSTPEHKAHLSPAAFDRDGLRLSVEPDTRATTPRTPPPQMQEQLLTPGGPRSTLAVIIIKPHAGKHRLKIERRITEAGFEILKERKMGFHLDGSGAVDLFGPDAPSLCGEPVWVFVLSRPRSASALSALVGPLDPLAARKSNPECLRALYGDNRWENGVWTTKDEVAAERIVSELFAGSPIMELSDLPSVDGSPDRRRIRKTPSHASSIRSHLSAEARTRTSSNSRGGSVPPPASVTKSPSGFKARPAPATATSPSIVPRTTRAADLRAGNSAPPPTRQRQSQEERERTFEGVPGHKRRESISVASTAAPVIAPRQNRSAMLRAQKQAEGDKPKLTKFPSMSDAREKQTMSPEELEEKKRATFEGVPGHKRRESIKVASTAAPTVAPRPNRSSLLRAQKMAAAAASSGVGGAPPSSFKGASSDNGPTRTLSMKSSTGSIGASSSKADRRASLQIPARPAPATVSSAASKRLSLAMPRQPSSNSNTGGALTPISNGTRSRPVSVNGDTPKAPPKPSPKKPDIEPRTNKSALLRAAAKLKSAAGATVGKSTARKGFAF
ncbi:unnamed protein product [Rhizoctonia solani]|uniref:Nucleoside diphosphate kinase n=1 Tax=Rhizoctonia solani TaxID=456999 RepID=A0A8H3BPL8_9AGAM|nr:unnamed protein product [Rhizoctonia solani]CAE6520494.1 unnamed protein product [Rhizoctonia solani]